MYSDSVGCCLSEQLITVCFLFLVFLFLFMCFSYGRLQTTGKMNWFGAAVILFFLIFGFVHDQLARKELNVDWPHGKSSYRAMLVSSPEVKSRSVMCEALVVPNGNVKVGWRFAPKIKLVLRKDSQSISLRVGQSIVFDGQVRTPVNRGNPDEFDYASFMFYRGLSGEALLWNGEWQIASSDKLEGGIPWSVRLKIEAQRWREWLLARYASYGLKGDEFALYSAMTLGDRSGMPQSLKTMYAAAGVSHVLALSGLHLCYLVALFGLVLRRIVRYRLVYVAGNLLAILLVWCFCLLAGMPSSLVRASLMYSLMLLGMLAGRKGFSVNSLAASAFLMLCISPLWLFDVSFQLSFLAMCGILGIGQLSMPQWLERNRAVRFVSESLLMSFKAQLTTCPLVAYLFHTFSLYSALSTLLLTPFTALLLLSMPLSVLTTVLPSEWSVVWFSVLTEIIKVQHVILEEIADWPFAVVELYPSLLMVVIVYLGLILWLCRHHLRMSVNVWSAVILLLAFVLSSWYNVTNKVSPMLVFYHNSSCPSVHFILSSRRSYLVPAWPDSVSNGMSAISRTFWKRRLSASPHVVHGVYDDGILRTENGLVWCGGHSLLMTCDNRWTGGYAKSPYPIDYLYICRGTRTSLDELSRLFIPRLVVLDGSLRWNERKRYRRQCDALGWKLYDMSTKGALKVPLK